MSQYDYDLFVIGAGSGGVRAARMAAMKGAKVAIAEEYRVGGTCVIRGCVPKKFLVYASEFRAAFKKAEGYGWTAKDVAFDWPTLRDAVHAEVDRLSGIYGRNLVNAGVEVIQSRAVFEDAHTLRLEAEDRTVTAKHVLIATGGAPARLGETPGDDLAITSNEAFHLEKLPGHIVISGGGYIACEFAQIFAGLGSDVCLVYRGDTVLRGFDEDVRTHVHEALKDSGVRVVTHAVFTEIEAIKGGRRVHLDTGDRIECDVVMHAIGRDPLTKGLGLEAAGVETDARGAVKVDAYSKTSAEHIYAVGDVTNRINLTPVAIREGAAFAETVFGNNPTAFDHADVASAVFTQPPVGSVGLTEAEARKQFGKIDIYKTRFRPMKNILGKSDARMLMKLVVKADDERVVGVHLAGDDAPEIIQAVAIAVKAGLTKGQFDAACAVHPTVAEELVTMKEKWVPPELGSN